MLCGTLADVSADAFARRLVVEAGKKSDLAWVGPPGGRQICLWCEWHDDALLLVTGGGEQPDPGLADAATAVVTLRSKDKGVRLVTFEAGVNRLAPRTPHWESAAAVLKEGRLNAPDAPAVLDRWADTSSLWELRPTGRVLESPGDMPADSQRAEPAPTSATTAGKPPLMIGRTPGRKRGKHL
jgi:hypothetical protein